MPPPIAVVDVGSNSGRVIVAHLDEAGHLEILADARQSLRLVHDVDAAGRLGDTALERTVAALQDFAAVARGAGAARTVAVATSAVRDAPNGPEFAGELHRRTGITVRVISGDEEARYAFLGAVHGLPVERGLLLDVGGGSAEVTEFRDRRPTRVWTLPLGALRLTERFLLSDPPRRSEVAALRAHVNATVEEAGIPRLREDDRLVGTGGTIRNLAKVHRSPTDHPIPRLHGYIVPARAIGEVTARLLAQPLARRAQTPGLSTDRADSISGGGLVVETIAERVRASELQVSGQGLREGIAFDELSDRLPSTDHVRTASVAALAARFRTWDERRAHRRRRLAVSLLESLDPGADGSVREALDLAATVLDVGRSVDYYNRWEHAAAIVVAADLRGFSHHDIALLASLIARAGRDAATVRRLSDLLGNEERRQVDRAAAVLALADEVERRLPRGRAAGVRARREGHDVVVPVALLPASQAYDAVERVEQLFDRRVLFEPGD